MPEQMVRRLPLLAWILLVAVGFATTARADGEAGLVIQEGGEVTTFCVAFSGDGITGQDLLKKAGIGVDAFGGGSGLAVCSLGNTGCKDSGSFTSCFCQCQGGDCTYWAFFTRQNGKNWVYSSMAFNLLKATDGDVHGWKWGKGAANSAPAPQDIAFSQICGHEPRGGGAPTAAVATTATATSQPTTAAVNTIVAPNSTTAASPASSPGAPSSITAAPTVTVTIGGTAVSSAAPSTVPLAPDGGDANEEGSSSYLAFGAIAAVLVAAIGGGLFWRRRNGG